ncbi:MAG: WD40/YVTN/BNR-like repeat-containing protein, partial [Acidimicrobiales bacterium]
MAQEKAAYRGMHFGARLLRSTASRLARVGLLIAVLIVSVLGSISAVVAASPASAAAAGAVAGWNPQQAPSGTTRLHTVFCANASVCFATGWMPSPTTEWGYVGVVLATTNGGVKWSPQSFPEQFGTFNQPCTTGFCGGATVFQPYGGACPTVSECFIAGYEVSSSQGSSDPALLETTDGGAKWTVHDQLGALHGGIGQVLNDVSCAGNSDCWAVGGTMGLSGQGGATVYATTDGGSSWAPQMLPSNISDLWKVDAVSSADIWAVGWVCPQGLANNFYCASGTAPVAAIVSTIDGGATWTEQSVPSGLGASYLDGVSFGSASDGVAAGFICQPTSCASGSTYSPVILSSTDGGATWGAVQVPGHPSVINDVSCAAGSSDCWAVGWSSTTSPPILSSTDGGATWTLQALPSNVNTLMGIAAPSSTDGFTVGQVC